MNPFPSNLVFPKSKMEHGIRIFFGATDPYCYFDLCKYIPQAYPKAVATTQNLLKGFLDLGFKDDDDVMEALKIPLKTDNKPLFRRFTL